MTNSELIKLLRKYPDNADIGYEHLKITYVTYNKENNYIDLGGNAGWERIPRYVSPDYMPEWLRKLTPEQFNKLELLCLTNNI